VTWRGVIRPLKEVSHDGKEVIFPDFFFIFRKADDGRVISGSSVSSGRGAVPAIREILAGRVGTGMIEGIWRSNIGIESLGG
jgi:hypothetical protein